MPGWLRFSANYQGGDGFAASTSSTLVETVGATATPKVQPAYSSITTAQSDHVTVTVSGSSGNLTPTGSVTLSSGSYTSSPAILTAGSTSITVPAGQLAVAPTC